ncbi:VCBS repeat-containing protein [Streptomyces sp. NPDC006552]|uniref:FG-GAP repeat domain-containing protein n=1 Tax=Streptomyces sp. NPDC006552 TaxID=3157179 RepID=UPI0033A21A54
MTAAVVVLAVVAYVVLLPSGGVRSVPNSPCRPGVSAREDPPAAPDLDGDGFADLVHEISDTEHFEVVVVPGSAHGPDRDRTTTLSRQDLGVPKDIQAGDDPWQPTVADLDEDGHAHLVSSGAASVLWGGREGPGAGGAHGRVPLPGSGYRTAPIAGDFDGDGHIDLVAFRDSAEDQELVVLKGPFERSGAPARTVEIRSPTHEGASPVLVAGDANDDRATDLALYDSPWDPSLLFRGGARSGGGLSGKPERLPQGENVVFGDFDGDGRQDTAVGRSFVDSYDEVDTPQRRGQVDVRYGKEPGEWVTMEGGDFQEGFGTGLAAGDFDGDGCDDLAVQLTKKKEAADARFEVLRGGSGHGLGSRPWRATKRSAPGDEGPVDGTLFGARDWDGDGRAELALTGGGQWWITDGTDHDEATFPVARAGNDVRSRVQVVPHPAARRLGSPALRAPATTDTTGGAHAPGRSTAGRAPRRTATCARPPRRNEESRGDQHQQAEQGDVQDLVHGAVHVQVLQMKNAVEHVEDEPGGGSDLHDGLIACAADSEQGKRGQREEHGAVVLREMHVVRTELRQPAETEAREMRVPVRGSEIGPAAGVQADECQYGQQRTAKFDTHTYPDQTADPFRDSPGRASACPAGRQRAVARAPPPATPMTPARHLDHGRRTHTWTPGHSTSPRRTARPTPSSRSPMTARRAPAC